MLLPGLAGGVQCEELSRELNDEEVHDYDNDPNYEEGRVVEEACANVDLVMNLPRCDHVNDLKPDEQVEDEGHVTARVFSHVLVLRTITSSVIAFRIHFLIVNLLVEWITVNMVHATRENEFAVLNINHSSVFSVVAKRLVGLWDHVFTAEEEYKEDDHLEDRHPDNVLAHLAGDHEVFLYLGRAFQKLGLGQLGGEGQRGKRIHNHVDPEELNRLQGRLFHEDGADHSEDHGVDVDSELELQETLDVVVDVSSPLGSFHDRGETVVHDDDIGGHLADIGSCHAHTEANIGFG